MVINNTDKKVKNLSNAKKLKNLIKFKKSNFAIANFFEISFIIFKTQIVFIYF